MAENKRITVLIEVKGDKAVANLRNVNGQMVALQVPIKDIGKELKKLNADVAMTTNEFNRQKQALIQAQNAAVIGSKKYNELGLAITQLNNRQVHLQKGMHGTSAATGSASASVLEMGRAISDSNYGIRGMANNLSQLASNMVYTTKAAGGTVAGLKAIWSAMLGPLGLILVFQGAIALLEKWSMSSDKAKVSTDDFAESLKELKTVIDDLYLSQDDLNDKIDEYINLTILRAEIDEQQKNNAEELEKVQERIDTAQKNYNRETEIRRKFEKKGVDNDKVYNMILKDQAKWLTELNNAKEERVALIKDSVEGLNKLKDGEDAYKAAADETLKALEDEKKQLEKQQKAVSKTSETYKDFAIQIEEVQKKIDAITGGKESKKRRTKTLRTYKEGLFDLSKFINRLERDQLLSTERNEVERLRIKQEYAQKDLAIQHELFIQKEELRLKNFMASKATDAEKLKAEQTHKQTLIDAETEYQSALTQLMLSQSGERFNKFFDMIREHSDKLKEAQQEGTIIGLDQPTDTGVDELENERAINEAKYQDKLYWIELEILRRKEAGKEYADLEQKKFNVSKQYENDKLVLARKVEEAKMGVAMQGLAVVQQIAGEGSAVGKAAGVAMATISTYEAATAALGAKPYGPWNIAQAAIVTAMGIANVQKILSTKIPNEKGTSSSANINTGRTFDFNLVGSTGENQLAQAIGGQIEQPIRAYVVSSEITNQQAFDNQIQGNATIGGD